MVLKNIASLTWLMNVHKHLQKDYDYLLVIAGDTGTGKSMFALQLLETWYKVILKQEVDEDLVKNINTDYETWLRRFKDLDAFDMNIYDEGGTALDSKDFMTKFSKDITKLFNVFRAKKFFTVIVLPNYFNLNKYFRENRLRGLVHVNKRGNFRLFTKHQINGINAHFENKSLKTLNYSKPITTGGFADYKGVMRKRYDAAKMANINQLLDQTINNAQSENMKKANLYELHGTEVLKMRSGKVKKKYSEISDSLGIPQVSIQRIIQQLKKNGKL